MPGLSWHRRPRSKAPIIWAAPKRRRDPLSVRFRRSLTRLRALPGSLRRDREAWKVFREWYYEADRREAPSLRNVTLENYMVRAMYQQLLEEATRKADVLYQLALTAQNAGGDPRQPERHFEWQRALDEIALRGHIHGSR